jgi:hypothetical protein
MSILEHLSISHCHILNFLIGRIPQAWSGGNDTMGIDKGDTVMINGALSTTVGDVKGVLGGGNRDVANVSLSTHVS